MSRLQRKRILAIEKRRAAVYIIGVICLFACFLAGAVQEDEAVPVSTGTPPVGDFWQGVIYKAVPALEAYQENNGWENHLYNGVRDAVYFLTQIRPDDLRTLLNAELALLPPDSQLSATVSSRSKAQTKSKKPSQPIKSGAVVVGIYHTHTSESFIPTYGKTHSPGGQRGEIVAVGQALADKLTDEGIGTVHSTDIHDYPSFMRAYGSSEETVKKMLADNESLEYIFDIHRDAEKRANVITEINGQLTASISIIVAQGREGLEQPHWQENLAAAERIKNKCDEKYPGLIREIQFAEWRYNEHLHNGLLILEVGSHETGADEAIRAIECFGDALAEVIRQSN